MNDEKALVTLFESLRGSLARTVRQIVPAKEIEDIVQETYVRICKAQGEQHIRSPRSFMFRTARNLALDYVRRAESRLSQSFDESEEATLAVVSSAVDSTVKKACSDEEFDMFCKSVMDLPEKCRQAFVMRKVYGYSQKEIASVMNISTKTVEKHIALGIRRCTEYMLQSEMMPGQDIERAQLRVVSGTRQGSLK